MLLQKTGWRIKQFISHRKHNSIEEPCESLTGRFAENDVLTKFSVNSSTRASWISQGPAAEITPLRRASSSATTSRPSVPTVSTAHSSASSLCSCECMKNPPLPSIDHSLYVPTRLDPRPEILYLSPASSSSDDAKIWRLIFPGNPSHSPTSSSSKVCTKISSDRASVRGSTFDLLEALTINPVDDDKTPTPSIRNMDEPSMDALSENVEQLIRETDKAFQDVGTALADAKAVTQGTYGTPATESFAASRGSIKVEPRPPAIPYKPLVQKTTSMAKGTRKTSKRKKTNFLSKAHRQIPPPPASTPMRWTLTDVTANMADVFSGKMFRTEVDEMLTPDRIQRLKEHERIEGERKPSIESTRSIETAGSTPTEPFFLEGLSSRITAAAQREHANTHPFPSPVLPPPPIPIRTSIQRSKQVKHGKIDAAETGMEDSEMSFNDLNFPSPPKLYNRLSPCGARHLPTIPEISPFILTPPSQASQTECRRRQFSWESIEPPPDYLLLPSTSFTLTAPGFRQGSIRIERQEKERVLEEEPLDWTAFQMAISGTMNEIGADERDDIESVADEAQLKEILEWWAGFGFDGSGSMVKDESPRGRKKLDVLVHATQKSNESAEAGTDKMVVEHEIQVRPTRSMRNGYAESLPPSPMLDLVPPSPSWKDELIPMGFNLGHDLGDFLDWENRHVRKYIFGED